MLKNRWGIIFFISVYLLLKECRSDKYKACLQIKYYWVLPRGRNQGSSQKYYFTLFVTYIYSSDREKEKNERKKERKKVCDSMFTIICIKICFLFFMKSFHLLTFSSMKEIFLKLVLSQFLEFFTKRKNSLSKFWLVISVTDLLAKDNHYRQDVKI